MRRATRRWLPTGLAVVLAGSGFAYLASNTVEASNAGMGSAAISGYQVNDITYFTNATGDSDSHHYLSSVLFKLTSLGGTGVKPAHVFAEFGHGGASTQLSECTAYPPGSWNYPTGQSTSGWGYFQCQVGAAPVAVSVHDADQLTVIAYQ